jgi:hypothetical protein
LLAVFAGARGYKMSDGDDAGPKPTLGISTSLPLQWSEGGIEADLAEDAQPHPVFVRLSAAYKVQPIDDLQKLKAERVRAVLLAQPRALRPAELAAFDSWIRDGGRALVLADPALQWGSLYPLGDKRRPLFTSMLSPLFTHWGLELVLPMNDESAFVIRKLGTANIRTKTPGEWLPRENAKDPIAARCRISAQGLLADCRIGKGRAVLLADADLLDTPYWEGRGVRMLSGTDEFDNILWLEAVLAALHDGRATSGDFMER